jgi:hypothetical protein
VQLASSHRHGDFFQDGSEIDQNFVELLDHVVKDFLGVSTAVQREVE